MSSRNLILVKHSPPEIIPTAPPNQWRLSDVGRARCELLANELKAYEPVAIVSSVEPKALETARIVASRLNRPVETIEGLHEHDRTGVTFSNESEFNARVADFFRMPKELVFGRETASQAHTRFEKAIEWVLEKYPRGNIVIVSHGTVITLYVSRLAGLEPFIFWKRLGLPSFVVFKLPDFELEKVVENVE